MRLTADLEIVTEQAFELIKSYALEVRRDGETLDELGLIEKVLWSENLVTAVHLLKGQYRELYDANIPLYLDRKGNLYRGRDERGDFIKALDLDLVYDVIPGVFC